MAEIIHLSTEMHTYLQDCIIGAGFAHGLGIGLTYDLYPVDEYNDDDIIVFIDSRKGVQILQLPYPGVEMFRQTGSVRVIADLLVKRFGHFVSRRTPLEE